MLTVPVSFMCVASCTAAAASLTCQLAGKCLWPGLLKTHAQERGQHPNAMLLLLMAPLCCCCCDVPLMEAADKCASKPTDSTPNSTGWPSSCAGTAVGASCKAPCDTAAGATGVGYTIDCNDVDLWGDVTGSCTGDNATAVHHAAVQ